MKSIKILQTGLILFFSFIISTSIAQVQYEKTQSVESIANERTQYEAKKLELDAKEAKSLGQINLMYTQQLMELKKQYATQDNKSEIEALKRSHSQKIKSLLSSKKYRKYLELSKEKNEKEEKFKKQD